MNGVSVHENAEIQNRIRTMMMGTAPDGHEEEHHAIKDGSCR